ncbi:MAG: hypothetical protein M1484_03630 [Patescibacteria group bacterium]|nr:hypothetical protein [Patescibacteria group bacterium]MCL5432151.1 hypothetical protein [Patescibacteria group bacterium]
MTELRESIPIKGQKLCKHLYACGNCPVAQRHLGIGAIIPFDPEANMELPPMAITAAGDHGYELRIGVTGLGSGESLLRVNACDTPAANGIQGRVGLCTIQCYRQ